MAVLKTGDLDLPDQILDPWLGKVTYGSAVATLSGATPMKFGTGKFMTFDIGEAEYVGEGANKGSSDVTSVVKRVAPYKFHKTVRWTEEVQWADEDEQTRVVEDVLALIQPALSRALDFGVFHGINPTTGTTVPAMTEKLSDTENEVSASADDKPYTTLDAADALVVAGGFAPSDVALDPTFAGRFTSLRSTQTEQRLYPGVTLATAPAGELDGHRTSVSNTVSAAKVISGAGSGIVAFDGDFSGIRWGIQRQIGLQMIEYGDPDGQGDLKRNNQVAFRAEVVYGWGIADLGAFAKVLAAPADDGGGE